VKAAWERARWCEKWAKEERFGMNQYPSHLSLGEGWKSWQWEGLSAWEYANG